MDFYTSFYQHYNNILISGYRNGKKVNERIPIKPTLFLPAVEETEYRAVDGPDLIPVSRHDFDSVEDSKEFINDAKSVGLKVYGMPLHHYVYVNENFKDMKFDRTKIRVLNFDIETDTKDGFGDAQKANRKIVSITVKMFGDKNVYVLGLKPYETKEPELLEMIKSGEVNIRYKQCKDERELLKVFVQLWDKLQPDIVTGWNIGIFDIQYVIKRMIQAFGEKFPKQLSPFKRIDQSQVMIYNRPHDKFDIVGIPTVDYIEVFKKFSFKNHESYSLNYISKEILDSTKLDYSEYGSLAKLYEQNHNKFIDYNIIDVIRVEQIDAVVKFLNMVYEQTYVALVNYADAFTTIRSWDVMIYQYLIEDKIVVPNDVHNFKERQIAGGHVKIPQVGWHEWVMSFDFKSLYPHLTMTFNISPDTFVGTLDGIYGPDSVDKILEGGLDQFKEYLKENNLVCTGKGTLFTRDKQGFVPAIMSKLFDRRAEFSKAADKAVAELAAIKNDITAGKKNKEDYKDQILALEHQIVDLEGKSQGFKILLNSGYGALSNEHNRWYSDDVAESITLSGQLSIKWVEKYINKKINEILNSGDADYIVAIDTDSLYISVATLLRNIYKGNVPEDQEQVVDTLERLSDMISGWIKSALEELYEATNAHQPKLSMSLEAIGSAIWVAKKRYVMSVPSFKKVRHNPPKLKIQGIESVRSSTPEMSRNAIVDAIPILIKRDRSELKKYIEQFREKYNESSFSVVASPRTVSDLEKYTDSVKLYASGCPIAVRGALVYNNLVRKRGLQDQIATIRSGDKVRFCYMKMPNPFHEDVIAIPDELPAELADIAEYIDYETQFNKTFFDPVGRLATAASIDLSDAIDIGEFFG